MYQPNLPLNAKSSSMYILATAPHLTLYLLLLLFAYWNKPCQERKAYLDIQSTLDISNCQGTNKFVPDIESSTYRVVILCKLIRMGPIVLFKTSRVRLIDYSGYRDKTVIYIYIALLSTPEISPKP